MNGKQIALYARVSSSQQAGAGTIESQSDTPGEAGGLMNGVASKAITLMN